MEGPSIDQNESEARLYLIRPAGLPADGLFSDKLAAVLEVVQPAAFLMPTNLAKDHAAAAALRQLCAKHHTAFFVQNDPDLAKNLDADGLHLSDPASVGIIKIALLKDQILGADAKRSRHDAMDVGESGADYVAFGGFGESVDDELLNIIAWWRDLFVLPCLTYASTVDEAAKLANAGADFIGVSDTIWNDPAGPEAGARRMQAAIGKN